MRPYLLAALLGAAAGVAQARGLLWGFIALACCLIGNLAAELFLAWRATREWEG